MFGEEMPDIENRVELASEKDEHGMPLGKITHGFNEEAVALFNANFEEGLAIAKATGAKEVWSNRGAMPTIHLMGGTIMGNGAGNSITNSYGQTHEIGNLWIAGPGIFPTSGAPIRPIRSLHCRCAGPSSSPPAGRASPGERIPGLFTKPTRGVDSARCRRRASACGPPFHTNRSTNTN